MSPAQRAAALRLIADQSSSNLEWSRQVVALLRELAAEPQGEPVARIRVWWKPSHDGTLECHAELTDFEECIDRLPEGEHLLYAHPPQRLPLTEDFINDIGFQCGLQREDARNPGVEEFARAIEAAQGIGETK